MRAKRDFRKEGTIIEMYKEAAIRRVILGIVCAVMTAAAVGCRDRKEQQPLPAGGSGEPSPKQDSKIKVKTTYYPALAWYGLKQAGFWREPMNPAQAEWTERLKPLLFEMGSPTALFDPALQTLLYYIPSYLEPNDPKELQQIFTAVKEFARSGSTEVFLTRWPRPTRYFDQWYCPPTMQHLQKGWRGREPVVEQIIDLWSGYMVELWPSYEKEYKEKIRELQLGEFLDRCEALHAFSFWSKRKRKMSQTSYPYKEFVVLLCPECPALVNRIGPEKIIVGANCDWSSISNAVVHEIGIRYLAVDRLAADPGIAPLLRSDYEGVTKLIETEICLDKLDLLSDLRYDPYVSAYNLQKLVNWRARLFVDTTFEDYLPKLYASAKSAGLF